jgi:hypothetical protein
MRFDAMPSHFSSFLPAFALSMRGCFLWDSLLACSFVSFSPLERDAFKSAIYYFASGASYLSLLINFYLRLRGGVKNCCFAAMLLYAILDHTWTPLFSPV